jgi:hypothetical protein
VAAIIFKQAELSCPKSPSYFGVASPGLIKSPHLDQHDVRGNGNEIVRHDHI